MYYTLRINDKDLMVKDFIYHLSDDESIVKIVGVWYGSETYTYLMGLLNDFCIIELVYDGKVFARLDGVSLNEVEYHLLDEDINFYGVFMDYSEDLSVLEDVLG